MNKFKSIFLVLFISIVCSVNVFSFGTYQKGDFQLGLRIPFAIPAFKTNFSQDNGGTVFFWDTGYKNIIAGLEADVGVFITPDMSIGGLLGYNFAYDRGDKLFSKVPLLFRFNYFPLTSFRYDVPLSVGLGVNYFKYRSMEHIVPEVLFETGFNIYWSDNWSALFRTGFWLYAELYADPSKINLSGVIPIVLGVTYRR